jgi:predicted metal-dependent hydrolase
MSSELRVASCARGVALFNSAEFWKAHEAWEEIWLQSTSDEKRFLQGLIQLAAAYHHVTRGTYSGAVRLFESSLQKLEAFPEGYFGIDRAEAVAAASDHREKIARGEAIDGSTYPKLRLR